MSRLPADAPRKRRYPRWGGAVEPILPLPGPVDDPQGFAVLGELHRQWLEARRVPLNTQRSRVNNLRYFAAWCLERGIIHPQAVTLAIIERYQKHVFQYRKPDGQPLSISTQAARISQVGCFFSWLTKRRLIPVNPAADVELPRKGLRLPRSILTLAQVDALLALPDVTRPVGLRNRAIMELFFATAMRREELVRLRLDDLRPDGAIQIIGGKGGKDRLVPLGVTAAHWIARYVAEVRPHWRPDPDSSVLFLTPRRAPLGLAMLTNTVREYVKAAGIRVRGGCHLFRHTCATLMLENGADLRFVQELLGHGDIRSTEIYTRVAIGALKEVHRQTHPAESGRGQAPGLPAAAAGAGASAVSAASVWLADLGASTDIDDATPSAP